MAMSNSTSPILTRTSSITKETIRVHKPLWPRHRRPFTPSKPRSPSTNMRTHATESATQNDIAEWAAPGHRGAYVSSLPVPAQTAVIAGIAATLAAGTAYIANVAGPELSSHLPSFLQVTRSSWFPLGPIFVAAGIAHFTEKQGFLNMYPHKGAWGIWYLPGSPTFHVYWTGVAEILGGLGLMIGALPFDFVPSWLGQSSAFGLFLLTAAVTPANVYMFTHNAPGPLPKDQLGKDQLLPWQGHAARGLMQAVLLGALWGIATASQ